MNSASHKKLLYIAFCAIPTLLIAWATQLRAPADPPDEECLYGTYELSKEMLDLLEPKGLVAQQSGTLRLSAGGVAEFADGRISIVTAGAGWSFAEIGEPNCTTGRWKIALTDTQGVREWSIYLCWNVECDRSKPMRSRYLDICKRNGHYVLGLGSLDDACELYLSRRTDRAQE